jgi:hypothetical protein
MATLSFDDVLHGPSVAVTNYCQGVCFKTGDNSVELCDDGLSQLKYDIICSLYHCYTSTTSEFFHFSCNNFILGEGKQYALKSWWPMDSTWSAHGSLAHWNKMSEAFFDKRLQELEGT